MGRPRITWLTPWVPDRNGGGGQIRQAYLLGALARAADISLFSNQPLRDSSVRDAVSSFELIKSPIRDWGRRPKWVRRIRDLSVVLYGREPREVSSFHNLRKALAPVVRRSDADAVIVEYAGLAPLINHRRDCGRPWILTLHNVGSVMERQEAALYSRGRHPWLHMRDGIIWESWEKDIPSHYERLVTVCSEDASHFRDRERRPPEVIPNGVDTDRFEFTEIPKEPKLVFTGALNTGPNYDGVLWFCREILPLVRAKCGAVTLDVVGSSAPPEIVDLAQLDGVSVHVDVADVVPYLRRARIAVVPLRIGTGTRLKALEAMSSGRPVVGTSVGLGGLEIGAGVHAEVVDDPESFASQICRLLSDDDHAARLTRQARKLVENKYSWATIGSQFVRLVTDTVS